MAYHGPEKRTVEMVKYSGKDQEQPSIRHEYPDGSEEYYENYGEYFSAGWSTEPTLSISGVFSRLKKIFPAGVEGGISLSVDIRRNEMFLSAEEAEAKKIKLQEWDMNLLEELAESAKINWMVDTYMGSFFCDRDESTGELTTGVLAPDEISNDVVIGWQQATASPVILQRGGRMANDLPAAEDAPQEVEEYLDAWRSSLFEVSEL